AGGPVAGNTGAAGDDDHALRLERPLGDPDPRRHHREPDDGRDDPDAGAADAVRRLRARHRPDAGRHRPVAGSEGGLTRDRGRDRDHQRRPVPAGGHDDDRYDHDDRHAVSRRIAVILGGRSSENPISVASATSVVEALEAYGDDVVAVQIDRSGRWQLAQGLRALEAGTGDESGAALPERLPPREVAKTLGDVDVVFPILHGPFGEDGTVQGLLELAGVPYVGAGVLASALC